MWEGEVWWVIERGGGKQEWGEDDGEKNVLKLFALAQTLNFCSQNLHLIAKITP